MPNLARLTRDVAAKSWRLVALWCQERLQWARRNPRTAVWVAVLAVAVLLLALTGGASWIWGKYHANREDLTPLATVVGGTIAAWVALRQVRIALSQAKTAADRHAAQTKADKERRITESFTKAIEQLGSDKMVVRLGGIYALERISQESSQDYWTVMESLTAFVRERTRQIEAQRTATPREERIKASASSLGENAGKPEGRDDEFWEEAVRREKLGDLPATDIAAVLTVINRRSKDNRELERAIDLSWAVLRWADLKEAKLKGALLFAAHLEHADLYKAHLERASLLATRLEDADLRGAHLNGAHFLGAHLEGADLSFAEGLTQEQIDSAYGDAETKLPEGRGLVRLVPPAHWTDPTAPRPTPTDYAS
jgi:hypothetical protein